jgi:hypothetical protein
MRMIKKLKGKLPTSGHDFATARPLQGYAFHEVYTEISRRRAGEYRLPPKVADALLEQARQLLVLRYLLSASLCDILEAYRLKPLELLAHLGLTPTDHAETLLFELCDPVPRGEPLPTHESVTLLYPGRAATEEKT